MKATADLEAARRRTGDYGLQPDASAIPHVGEPGADAVAWRDLSRPIVESLVAKLSGSPVAVVFADADGRVIDRHAGDNATLQALDDRSIDLGYSLAEQDAGINGVGTSLESKKPALIVGDDHFLEVFQSFTCAHAPVVDPLTQRVVGTIGVVCPAEQTHPLLLPTAEQLAAELASLQAQQSSATERFLLQQFLRAHRSSTQPIATIGNGLFIGTAKARELLGESDQTELWARIEGVLRRSSGDSHVLQWMNEDGSSLDLRVRAAYRGGELDGATLEIRAESPPALRPRRRLPADALAGLIGSSTAWRAAVREALAASRIDAPTLVVGERGSGRMAVAHAIAALHSTIDATVCDSALLIADGAQQWLSRLRSSVATGQVVILRRIDELTDDVASAAVSILRSNENSRILATCSDARVDGSAIDGRASASLIDEVQVLRVNVPPLRERRDDISLLVKHFARAAGQARVDASVASALYHQPWPGNLTELRQTVRAAVANARGAELTADHIPLRLRAPQGRKPLHGLRQLEADAITNALERTSTRSEAAKLLGISRATLYRRIAAYDLD